MTSPIVSLPVLQDVIRRAVDRWPESRGRIERAGALIVLGAVEQLTPDSFAVRSQTDHELTYTVTPGGCPCVDAMRHPGQSCKHVWAVDLLAVAEERQRRLVTADREQAARARCSADTVALAYARSVGWAA